MSNLGDINGDGFEDVGLLLFDGFSVYLGTETGLSDVPDLTGEDVAPDDFFFVQSLAGAGDVNGDGFDDMIMGDPYWDTDDDENVGSARLFYGSADGFDPSNYWEIIGDETEANLGDMVSGVGDVNGDGFDDMAISAPGDYDESSTGTFYIFHGSEDGPGDSPDFSPGEESSFIRFGESISGAGDVNGDGYNDVLAGGGDAELVFLYYGSPEGLLARPAAEIEPELYDFIFGEGVIGLGDVNGDGFADVAVDAEDIDDLIKAYVYYGSEDGLADEPDVRIALENSNFMSSKIAGVGDVNGDGFADLAFGLAIPGYEDEGSGTVYLFYGSEDGLPEEPSSMVSGAEDGDEFGSVLTSGDVNGDGISDLFVGAPYSTEGGDYAGKVYLFDGSEDGISYAMPSSMASSLPSSDEGALTQLLAELPSLEPGSLFGYQAEGVGDVNGDGYVDLLVTAIQAEGLNGAAYLYLGSQDGFAAEPDWQVTGENPDESFGFLGGSAGDLNGDGYMDLFVTAPFFEGNQGKVYVYHGSEDGLADEPQWWFTGNEAGYAGYTSASVGDIDGDGYDDFAISVEVTTEDDEIAQQMGLFYGSETGLSEDVGFITDAELDLGAFFGAAGDVNGDGYADLFVVPSLSDDTPGTVAILHGGADGLDGTIQFSGEGESAGDYYGWEASKAGDVNGDGYDDFLVAAPATNETTGTVYLYYGSEAGLESPAGWETNGYESESWFGVNVAALGDINADGFADFAIGEDENPDAPTYVHIYLGSANGPDSEPFEVHEVQLLDFYDWGTRVSPAGDVNMDGKDDYLIAEPDYPDGAEDGRVSIYSMGASEMASESNILPALGWNPSREQLVDSGEPSEAYGWQTVILEDVNGDGYDELAIASFGNPSTEMAGRLLVHYGSEEGISNSADWETALSDWPVIENDDGETIEDMAVFMVASIGDVNGDGFADVAASISSASADASLLLIYHGSEEGLSAEPDWIGEPDEQFAEIIGVRVARLGDVNGDGYADVGVVTIDVDDSDRANIAFYHGSESGLESESALSRSIDVPEEFFLDVAGAGDLNEDGYDDILIGLPQTEDNDASQLMVLMGSEEGIDIEPVWSADSALNEGSLGLRVAGIGDINGDSLLDFATTELFDDASLVRVYLNEDELTEQTLGGDPEMAIGLAIQGIGDVNGDGYDDLLTGSAILDAAPYTWQIFPGGPDGIGTAPLFESEVDSSDPFFMFFQQYGRGDLNGDGYADFALSDFDFEAIQTGEDVITSVTVYYGGESMMDESSEAADEEANEEANEEADDDEATISDDPSLAESLWEIGTDLLLEGEYDLALIQFDLAIESDPTLALAHNGRGRVFLAQELFSDSIENFDRAIEEDDEFWQAYFNRATAYYKLDGFEEAVADMDMVVELLPDYADTYYWRGFAHLGLDNVDEAIEDFTLLLELDPEHPQKDEVEGVLADLE